MFFLQPEVIGRYAYGLHKRQRRPLGVSFSPQNTNELYFVDAYQGIFMFNTYDSNDLVGQQNMKTVEVFRNISRNLLQPLNALFE